MPLANTNPKLKNLSKAFASIPNRYSTDTTVFGSTNVKLDFNSHVQGIARAGRSLIVTHSDANEPSGLYLLIEGDAIACTRRLPPARDRNPYLNHCGGCQRIGDYLVIPNEAIFDPLSRVSFFDISDLSTPRELTSPPPIDFNRKTGAAGVANVTRDGVEYWYLAAYDNGHVMFYKSDGQAFPTTVFGFEFEKEIMDGYQSFCLLADSDNRLYAFGFRLDASFRDWVDVWEVLPESTCIEIRASRQFRTNGVRNVHFRWGAGVDIPSEDRIELLSTGHVFSRLPVAATGDVQAWEELERSVSEEDLSFQPRCHIDTFGP
ncbi:MAG TPA: hypothetical protein VGQ37_25835 [Vicinamibacterales bacterium]|jgi:hypothetical protein|nr:hypothetical protein [Vicinamibacterales bacterium]